MPQVSVIMPSYNHEKFIYDSINSVLNQTFEDFELIIIDDASNDHSKTVIKSFEKKDDRIRAYFHQSNIGVANTMNEIINHANGKFIAFTASDDVWVKYKLEKQMKILIQNENLVVWSDGEIIDEKGNLKDVLFTEMHDALEKKKNGNIYEDLLKRNYIFGSSLIVKRKNLNNIKYDAKLKYLNDYKFMLELALNYDFYFIKESLVKYRIHGQNTILTADFKQLNKENLCIKLFILKNHFKDVSNNLRFNILLTTILYFINYILQTTYYRIFRQKT